MGHKVEQIYKQTGCRLVPGQCPENDPTGQIFVWTGRDWLGLKEPGHLGKFHLLFNSKFTSTEPPSDTSMVCATLPKLGCQATME